MRKTSTFLGLALAFGIAGAAQAQQTQPEQRRAQQGEQRVKGERGERGGRQFRGQRGPGGRGFLLRGVELTDAQKTQLRQLREQNRERNKAQHEALRKEMSEARALRQKGDTAAARARLQSLRARGEQFRAQETAAIRSILTAEQRAKFDANVAEAKERGAKGEGRRGGKGRRQARG